MVKELFQEQLTEDDIDILRENFESIWKPYYRQPHRFYHNVFHIDDMLNYVVNNSIPISMSGFLAILFHDSVYVPGSVMNEKMSAENMESVLSTYDSIIENEIIEEAKKIILATKTHEKNDECEEINTICDLDLFACMMGNGFNNYNLNSSLIRIEYSMFNDEQWMKGRKDFLNGMLERDKLFHSKYFKEFEEELRNCFANELVSISQNIKH